MDINSYAIQFEEYVRLELKVRKPNSILAYKAKRITFKKFQDLYCIKTTTWSNKPKLEHSKNSLKDT